MTARTVRTGGHRGRPVFALTAILLGWIMVRMLIWSAQSVLPELPARSDYIAGVRMPVELPGRLEPALAAQPAARTQMPNSAHAALPTLAPPPRAPLAAPPPASLPLAPRQLQPAATSVQMATMLWLAALAQVPVPLALLNRREPPAAASALTPAFSSARDQADGQRWSVDGWLMWRRGSAPGLVAGALPSTYGGSQLGAVARYRLAPASRNRPALYLRATAPLEGQARRPRSACRPARWRACR